MDALSSLRHSASTAVVMPAAPTRALNGKPQDIEEITVTAKAPEEEGFSFFDFLDVINPLQHIPIVNTVYREITGDTIKAPAKMMGAALLAGPVGLAAAMVDTVIQEATGKDLGGHAMAMFKGDEPAPEETPQIFAEALPAAAPMTVTSAPVAAKPALSADAAAHAPTEAEAQIAAAQIAAKANVLAPLKRDVNPYASPMARNVEAREAERQMSKTRHAVFMPLNRGAAGGREMVSPTRQVQDNVSVNELRATAKFAPGSMNVGGGSLSPAAVTAASKNKHDNKAAAANGAPAPVNVPTWFDDAMMKAMDKYEAAKTPVPG